MFTAKMATIFWYLHLLNNVLSKSTKELRNILSHILDNAKIQFVVFVVNKTANQICLLRSVFNSLHTWPKTRKMRNFHFSNKYPFVHERTFFCSLAKHQVLWPSSNLGRESSICFFRFCYNLSVTWFLILACIELDYVDWWLQMVFKKFKIYVGNGLRYSL